MPDAKLVWFEGGHLFMIQDKSAWTVIIDFLSPALILTSICRQSRGNLV